MEELFDGDDGASTSDDGTSPSEEVTDEMLQQILSKCLPDSPPEVPQPVVGHTIDDEVRLEMIRRCQATEVTKPAEPVKPAAEGKKKK